MSLFYFIFNPSSKTSFVVDFMYPNLQMTLMHLVKVGTPVTRKTVGAEKGVNKNPVEQIFLRPYARGHINLHL